MRQGKPWAPDMRSLLIIASVAMAVAVGAASSAFAAQGLAPVVGTDGAIATGATSAVVDGNADPEGQSTTLRAAYALASDRWCVSGGMEGTPAETAPRMLGSISGMISEISVGLEGLLPGSEYCTELVAQNASGASHGAQRYFTTPAAQQVEETEVPQSAYPGPLPLTTTPAHAQAITPPKTETSASVLCFRKHGKRRAVCAKKVHRKHRMSQPKTAGRARRGGKK